MRDTIGDGCQVSEIFIFKSGETVDKPIQEASMARVEPDTQFRSKPEFLSSITVHKEVGYGFFTL
jgi:hypothetical protein